MPEVHCAPAPLSTSLFLFNSYYSHLLIHRVLYTFRSSCTSCAQKTTESSRLLTQNDTCTCMHRSASASTIDRNQANLVPRSTEPGIIEAMKHCKQRTEFHVFGERRRWVNRNLMCALLVGTIVDDLQLLSSMPGYKLHQSRKTALSHFFRM